MTESVIDPVETTRPLPPDDLQYRVAGTRDGAETFRESGRASALDIEQALAVLDRPLDSFDRILDFGCGCGRVVMWMERLATTSELYGTDIDAEAVEWAAEHFPYARFHCNGELPPLPYPNDRFDLVFSCSVFTHIDEAHQDAWLAELRRVTRPGGYLLLSVHGERAFRHVEAVSRHEGRDTTGWAETLATQGILFLEDHAWAGAFPDWYQSTFHAPWYVFAHWGRDLAIRAFLPRRNLDFQDYVLLERPPIDRPIDQPLVPPIAELEARLTAMEQSRSWRLARVLTRIVRLGRNRQRDPSRST